VHWLVTARVNSQLGKLDPGDGFRPFQDEGRRRWEAPSSPASKPCLDVLAFRSARLPGPRVPQRVSRERLRRPLLPFF